MVVTFQIIHIYVSLSKETFGSVRIKKCVFELSLSNSWIEDKLNAYLGRLTDIFLEKGQMGVLYLWFFFLTQMSRWPPAQSPH